MTRGPLHWFIHNPIAANLLMILLILGGVTSIPGLDKQFFPQAEINQVSITMPFPGAGPREVEEQICVRIEEAIHDLSGIDEIRSTAREGSGQVMVEAIADYPMQRLTNDIKTRVDAINTFPADAERPVVTELTYKHMMGVVHVAGDIDPRELKELGERLRDDLARQPWISLVELRTAKPYEVSVEVSELDLRRYGLTFEQVVSAIRGASLNLPAGAIKSAGGDIRVQTRGQAYERDEFERIVVSTTADGTQIHVGDVASVVDGFEDVDVDNLFNGRPALGLYAYVTSDPDVLQSSKIIRQWVEEKSAELPPNVELTFWRDTAKPFRDRVRTLLENGIGGLILVSLVLVLFLRPKLALWVTSGIAVAFLGTFFLLPYTGISLNMISLFAFLLVLGIVVDDAIIVGEAVHSAQSRGETGEAGALAGVRSVFKPVLFAVISTMVFFVPMLMLPGDWAVAARSIPTVVLLALTFSLIECLLILPAHLAHMGPEKPARSAFMRRVERLRHGCADWLVNIARYRFRPFLAFALRHHLMVGGVFLVAFAVSIA
ncbi:MAG: efflux RND transporter permease subunit, partial [Halieaceae bacterium]|nr:efflux RND transporter permease subunit [Halieaceae bacterium]